MLHVEARILGTEGSIVFQVWIATNAAAAGRDQVSAYRQKSNTSKRCYCHVLAMHAILLPVHERDASAPLLTRSIDRAEMCSLGGICGLRIFFQGR